MVATFSAPYTPVETVLPVLREHGFAVLAPTDVVALSGALPEALQALQSSWDDLHPDTYLKDAGNYRKRRHSCFIAESGALRQVPHRAHWQPKDYNALHGGMRRWFEPIDPSVVVAPAWPRLLLALADVCSQRMPVPRWHIEAHQFRIDTGDGIGRPTPEGAHRDGVDFVAVILVARHAIRGGETRVFEADGPAGQRFTLSEPWSLLLLDDARMIHETTPIQPIADPADGEGHRDTLVLTYRAAGFQGDN
jgi:hypothetical protein